MMRFTAMFALSILLIGSTGCAKEWAKPGATAQQLNADRLSCEQDAEKMYPVVHDSTLTYRPAASSKLETSCVQQGGFNNCDAGATAGAPSAGAPNDASAYDRGAAVKTCLLSKGYSYKKSTP